MTPLGTLLSRWLPRSLVPVALGALYLGMALAIAVSFELDGVVIQYIQPGK